jgi:formylglycine-generating enzyme required for sulfatase activity
MPGEVREMTALKIPFCWCPPGKFVMGSDPSAPGHMLNEPQHEVTLTKGFWLQKTELTQSQFQAVMGVNPAFYPGESNPVETVSWNAATEFATRLSALPPEAKSGNVYRLPTEAEWEYACRAGSTSEFGYGDDPAELEKYGWINTNSKRTTHPVGEKLPNAWGMHDMHGNVAEWCLDWYGDYPSSSETDPQGPESGESRVLRGGSWFYDPTRARCAFRNAFRPDVTYVGLGFRLVTVPK